MRANDSSVRARSSNFDEKNIETNLAAKRSAMTFPFSSSQLPNGCSARLRSARPRRDHRGADLIAGALRFGCLCCSEAGTTRFKTT
jgi:hypothetical protein